MFSFSSKFYFDNGLKIFVEQEILRYYFWHVMKSPYDTLGQAPPMRKAHISIILPRIHGMDKTEASKKYVGRSVDVQYEGLIEQGGTWFTNYWMRFSSSQAQKVKTDLGIVESRFLGYHLTICNNKGRMNEICSEMADLSRQMNEGAMSVDEFRQHMLNFKKKIRLFS